MQQQLFMAKTTTDDGFGDVALEQGVQQQIQSHQIYIELVHLIHKQQ